MKGSPNCRAAISLPAQSRCLPHVVNVSPMSDPHNPGHCAELPKYVNWPTFPQLWVDGERSAVVIS
ncbi:glutaredoxin domain-containing protein [Shigella flexneri]